MVVYEILNVATGEKYIGSTVQFGARMAHHKYLLRKNRHHSWKLQAAYNIVGWEGFKVRKLEECATHDEVRAREQHHLDTLKPSYNVSLTANFPTMTPAGRLSVAEKRRAAARLIQGFPITYWAEKLGLKVSAIGMRLAKGWSEERAVTTPNVVKGRRVTLGAETLTRTQLAAKYGQSICTLGRRLRQGVPLEEALKIPPLKGQKMSKRYAEHKI